MEKLKVLIFNSTLLKGGTESYVFSIIENIDRTKFDVSLLIKNDGVDADELSRAKKSTDEIEIAGGGTLTQLKRIKQYFKNNSGKFDVCHINATSAKTGIIAYYAKKYGKIKNIIFHSHMSGNDNKSDIFDIIGKKLIFKCANKLASCSDLASEFMFGKQHASSAIVLNNAVDTSKFVYSETIRQKIRAELKTSNDTFVILHVGRFVPQKNQKRLIEILAEIIKQNANVQIWFIGDGEQLEEAKTQVSYLNLENYVKFLGLKTNVNEYMISADCFAMPSLHEGLPIVAVEAQSAGLPLILSDAISKQTKLTENVKFLSLNSSNEEWANAILANCGKSRKDEIETVRRAGFDKSSAIKLVENLYSGEK